MAAVEWYKATSNGSTRCPTIPLAAFSPTPSSNSLIQNHISIENYIMTALSYISWCLNLKIPLVEKYAHRTCIWYFDLGQPQAVRREHICTLQLGPLGTGQASKE